MAKKLSFQLFVSSYLLSLLNLLLSVSLFSLLSNSSGFHLKELTLSLTLVVAELSFFTTHQELKNLFSPFGVVKEANLIRDPKTQRPKGFGFVTFETESEAQKALKAMNGRIVRGRLIFVEYANDRSPAKDTNS